MTGVQTCALPIWHKKYIVWADIAANLGILVFFKYTWFLVGSINQGFGTQFKALGVTLPIGISFFTFQAISYVVDVYRGKIQAQENFWKLLLYISFFPQLIAGPIVKYRDVNAYLDKRKVGIPQAASGLRRFICGLGKKVLIANAMGQAADAIFSAGAPYINILSAWVGAIAYMLQIYYDFSGYSDMAIGLGQCLASSFRKISSILMAPQAFRNFGTDGIFPCPPGLRSTYIFPWAGTGKGVSAQG